MGEDISKEDDADVEEETHDDELAADALDDHELDDYAVVASHDGEITANPKSNKNHGDDWGLEDSFSRR